MTTEPFDPGIRDLALPDSQETADRLGAIAAFQEACRTHLVKGVDYGEAFEGSNRNTLLKPGAEKLVRLMGLRDEYEIIKEIEDWTTPLFAYTIRCRLVHLMTGIVVAEGMGHCNSKEAKYAYRWVSETQVRARGLDPATLPFREMKSRFNDGMYTSYRVENDDIFDNVNTMLKIAEKRALVDAALGAGRLSNVFTQDTEDIADNQASRQGQAPRAGQQSQPRQGATPMGRQQPPADSKPEDPEMVALRTLQSRIEYEAVISGQEYVDFVLMGARPSEYLAQGFTAAQAEAQYVKLVADRENAGPYDPQADFNTGPAEGAGDSDPEASDADDDDLEDMSF